jgi:mannose-6-phosphate isomerase-like protein (cupin superfamily)
MLVKTMRDCIALTANDGCRLFELLHPKNDDIELPYSLAIAEVEPHQSSYRHRLKQTEVYYVLAGSGLMHIDEETQRIGVGDAVVIPAGTAQWIENPDDQVLRFAALVSPPWRDEDDQRL